MSSIGGTTLPREPDAADYSESTFHVSGQRRALDGTLQTCIAATRRRWHVPVRGLTAAEKDTLLATLATPGALTWVDPGGTSWTVVVVGEATASPTRNAEGYWDVVWDMEQV